MGEIGKLEMTLVQVKEGGSVGRCCNWDTEREEAAREGSTSQTRMGKEDEVLLCNFSFGIIL